MVMAMAMVMVMVKVSINSSNGIQGKLILPLKISPEIREDFACFVECTKFVQFVDQGERLAGSNEEKGGHTVTTINFNSDQKRLSITTERIELTTSYKEKLRADWLTNNEPKVKKVSTLAHMGRLRNSLPCRDCS
jgi:hypothetical protein